MSARLKALAIKSKCRQLKARCRALFEGESDLQREFESAIMEAAPKANSLVDAVDTLGWDRVNEIREPFQKRADALIESYRERINALEEKL